MSYNHGIISIRSGTSTWGTREGTGGFYVGLQNNEFPTGTYHQTYLYQNIGSILLPDRYYYVNFKAARRSGDSDIKLVVEVSTDGGQTFGQYFERGNPELTYHFRSYQTEPFVAVNGVAVVVKFTNMSPCCGDRTIFLDDVRLHPTVQVCDDEAGLSASRLTTCGVIASSRNVACWGRNSYGEGEPPANALSQTSGGYNHQCGIVYNGDPASGNAQCWGAGEAEESGDGTQYCYASNWYCGQSIPPATTILFSQISSGHSHNCGITVNPIGISCWGNNLDGELDYPFAQDTAIAQISTGGKYTCVIFADGRLVQCFGFDGTSGTVTPPGAQGPGEISTVAFLRISSGSYHTCGIRADGSRYISCWGHDGTDGAATPPTNTAFKSISTRKWRNCGIRVGGRVQCWYI